MSDDYTRFRLNLPHFSIELAGERTFVEELYRKVYRDLLPLIEAGQQPSTPAEAPKKPDRRTMMAPSSTSGNMLHPAEKAQLKNGKALPRNDYTWIYNCTAHYNKVYVVENQVIWHSFYGRYLDPRRLRRVHVDRERTSHLFKELAAGNRTLWAEITPEGRRMIEQASKSKSKK